MRTIICAILCFTILLCNCQKEDQNGALGGFWRVIQVTHTDSAKIESGEKSLFWRVQLNLMQFGSEYARFQQKDDSLYVWLIGKYKNCLKEYGMFRSDESFLILHLDRNSMALESDSARVRLKKF